MKNKKNRKNGWRITGIIFSCLFLAVSACMLVSVVGNKLNIRYAKSVNTKEASELAAPVLDEETGFWTFTCDRTFKIMQLTDVHVGGGFISMVKDRKALEAVSTLILDVKPDLVIITGDIAYPVPFQAGTFNNMTPVTEFTALMEKLGVYWTFTYGNHDTEVYSFYERADIDAWYAEQIKVGNLTKCLYKSSFSGNIPNYEGCEGDAGYGNTVINIKNSAGVITQSLFLFDSHSYEEGFYQEYDHMHKCQIDWYVETLDTLNKANKKTLGITDDSMTVKSLAFYHIPSEEYKSAYTEWYNNNKSDTANVKLHYGIMGEDIDGKWVYCGVTPDEMFETMLRFGSTQGIFCGHDHYNNFSLDYNGGSGDKFIRLTYGLSIDYLAYHGIDKETEQRGCTIIEIASDSTFDCYGYKLVDKSIIR